MCVYVGVMMHVHMYIQYIHTYIYLYDHVVYMDVHVHVIHGILLVVS